MMEHLGRYAFHTYTHGEDIQYLIRTLQLKIINKPETINEDDKDTTNKRIWEEKQVDEYVKRLHQYGSNKRNLYSVVWD